MHAPGQCEGRVSHQICEKGFLFLRQPQIIGMEQEMACIADRLQNRHKFSPLLTVV